MHTTISGKAKQSHVIKTHSSLSSIPKDCFQAVVCISTSRMYPRSRYFLVLAAPFALQKILSEIPQNHLFKSNPDKKAINTTNNQIQPENSGMLKFNVIKLAMGCLFGLKSKLNFVGKHLCTKKWLLPRNPPTSRNCPTNQN